MSSTSTSSFDDSDFASFTYKQAILFIGLRVDPRLREIIQDEVSRLKAENKRLRQENNLLRQQTKEEIAEILDWPLKQLRRDFDPDQEGKELSGDDSAGV